MRVHHGFYVRTQAVYRRVHGDLAGALQTAGDLIALHIDHDQIVRLHQALAHPGRRGSISTIIRCMAGTCGVDPSAPSYDVWRADQAKRTQSGTIGILVMVKTEREYRDDICQIGRLVFQKGWVAANDGNITIRLDAERILATPTGVCKGLMQPDDLILVDMKGNKISGRLQGTSEIAMHTTVYGLRPDIKAVVHAHPPVATGFATAGRQLNLALLPEVII